MTTPRTILAVVAGIFGWCVLWYVCYRHYKNEYIKKKFSQDFPDMPEVQQPMEEEK